MSEEDNHFQPNFFSSLSASHADCFLYTSLLYYLKKNKRKQNAISAPMAM